MKSDKLTKYYSTLSIEERLPLIVAACDRGDTEERQRLIDSAPRETFTVPHHHRYAMALKHLSHLYLLRQLDLLTVYFRIAGTPPKPAADASDDMSLAYAAARLFTANADAWEQFCRPLGIEPDSPLEGLSGHIAVDGAICWMRYIVENHTDPSADEGELITADDMMDALRSFL